MLSIILYITYQLLPKCRTYGTQQQNQHIAASGFDDENIDDDDDDDDYIMYYIVLDTFHNRHGPILAGEETSEL